MLQLDLGSELEAQLAKIAQDSGKSVGEVANAAIQAYIEDREDYLLGMAVLNSNEKVFTIEEVRQELGLDA